MLQSTIVKEEARLMKLSSFFKRKYRYGPIAYIGRKQVQRILDAKIIKLKKLDRIQADDNKEAST